MATCNKLKNKAKIVVHVYGNYPKKIGSIEEYYFALTRKLNEEGFKTIFIFTGLIDEVLKKRYDELGAEIIVVPGTLKRFDCSSLCKYWCFLRKVQPVLINVNFGRTSFNALVAAWLAGVTNTVWTKHSFVENGPFYQEVTTFRILTSLVSLTGYLSKKVIAVSEGMKKELCLYRVTTTKIVRIYLGINLERFKSLDVPTSILHEIGVQKGDRVISCISQARPEKGLEYLIRAIPRVVSEIESLKVLIVGGGPLTESLKELAVQLNVRKHIVFCGVRNDIEKVVAVSEFTVLPSITEGLGLVILESLAGGKPVVASNVGGVPEVVVDGQTGFLVPPRDEQALAEKIVLLFSDVELLEQMRINCFAKAKLFDVNVGAGQTIELYKDVIENNV